MMKPAALLVPVASALLLIACGSSDSPPRTEDPSQPEAGSPVPSAEAGAVGTDAGVGDAAAEAGGPTCSDAAIDARTTPLNGPSEYVHAARFSADGSAIFYAYHAAVGGGGGIKRVDLCGVKSDVILAQEPGNGLTVGNDDVGYFQLGLKLVSAPMTPGTVTTPIADPNIQLGLLELQHGYPVVFAALSFTALLRFTSGVEANVTEQFLGAGHSLYSINGLARGFRITRDGARAAFVDDDAGSGPPGVVVYDLATNTRRRLALDDFGVGGPATNLAWASDHKTLFLVAFSSIVKVDSSLTTKQSGTYVGKVANDATVFDVAKDDRRYLSAKNGELRVRVAK
jgi:hypothetical protein